MIGQYYPETQWEKDRLGKFTASKIHLLFTEPKSAKDKAAGNLSETAKDYIETRAAELITGQIRGVSTNATEWGRRTEPMAIEFLRQFYNGIEYFGMENQVFFPYDNHSGGSPDALRSATQVFEGKCPEDPAKHVKYCRMKTHADLLKEHYFQIQFNMVCVAKKNNMEFSAMEGVFFSFYPDVVLPFAKMKTIKVPPDFDFYKRLPGVIEKAEIYLAEVMQDLNPGEEQKQLAA